MAEKTKIASVTAAHARTKPANKATTFRSRMSRDTVEHLWFELRGDWKQEQPPDPGPEKEEADAGNGTDASTNRHTDMVGHEAH